MPLRIVRTKIKAKDVALAVTSLAGVISDVVDVAQFPPARAAATIVLVILQTIQEIESNKDSCARLGRRAAKILLDLQSRMEGRWENAPPSLTRNIGEFEKYVLTLFSFEYLVMNKECWYLYEITCWNCRK